MRPFAWMSGHRALMLCMARYKEFVDLPREDSSEQAIHSTTSSDLLAERNSAETHLCLSETPMVQEGRLASCAQRVPASRACEHLILLQHVPLPHDKVSIQICDPGVCNTKKSCMYEGVQACSPWQPCRTRAPCRHGG